MDWQVSTVVVSTVAAGSRPTPQLNPILSFSHTFPRKSTRIGGRRPSQRVGAPNGKSGSAADQYGIKSTDKT